jgi:hypothetical protein
LKSKYLFQLEKKFKSFLLAFVLALTFGVVTGLIYLYYTTEYKPGEAIKRYNGSEIMNLEEAMDIPEYYPKPISELLITTHTHVITFSFIFLCLGGIFYFNSIITGFFKQFLIIEPFVSTIISFSSLWAMRFVHPAFVYLTALSSTLIYLSYLIMVFVVLYELSLKKN